MSNLPQWARKPNHKKEVVATPRGWMVKETGEYLKLVRDLDQRLKALKQEVEDVAVNVYEPSDAEPVPTPTQEDIVAQEAPQGDLEQNHSEEQVEEKPKKRRGRPRKKKTEEE